MRSGFSASVAMLAILLTAGCAGKVNDATLVTNITAQMFSDSQLTGSHLQVTSADGQVTLSGTVPSDAARLDAYKIATQTPGVTKVNDQMTVQSTATQPLEPQPEVASQLAPPAAPERSEKRHGDRLKKFAANANPPVLGETANDAPLSSAPPEVQEPQTPPPAVISPISVPPPSKQVDVPANITLTIRMIDAVDSSVNKVGEIFHASLDSPILVDNQIVVPAGADVYVRLANASSAGHMSGQSVLRLELVKLEFQGQSYPLVSGTYSLAGSSRGKDTAKKVGAGAVLGTLIGAIAGGGKGAAIGAAAGAGAGGVYQASTSGKQVKIPSETKLDFQLEQPVTVTVVPPAATTQ
jgi:hypothetical protein